MHRVIGTLFLLLMLLTGCRSLGTEKPSERPPSTVNQGTTDQGAGTTEPAPPAPAPSVQPANTAPTASDSSGEKTVPLLPFRPTLLLSLGFGGHDFHRCIDVYGYDVNTGELGRLTEAGPACLAAGQLTVSSDGEWFAYARYQLFKDTADRACLRRIQGGEPYCGGKPFGLAWRPGTHELLVSGGKPVLLRPDGSGVKESDAGADWDPRVMSPDWRSRYYFNNGLWVAETGGTKLPQKLTDTAPFKTIWVDNTRLALLEMENDRLGKLTLIGADGKATAIGRAFQRSDDKGLAVIHLRERDPQGRYLLVDYGRHGGVTETWGSALFDLGKGIWIELPTGEGTYGVAWVANGRWLLLQNKQGKFLFDPTSGQVTPLKNNPPGSYLTSSPDGQWLVFYEQAPKQLDRQLYLYRVKTGDTRKIEANGFTLYDAVWVPAP